MRSTGHGGVVEGRVPKAHNRKPPPANLARDIPYDNSATALAYAGNAGGFDYLDTPNLAGYEGFPPHRRGTRPPETAVAAAAPIQPLPPMQAGGRAERILEAPASEPAPSGSGPNHTGGRLYIPPEGVDVDAALGIGGPEPTPEPLQAGQHEAAPPARRKRLAIAEDNPSQTVVDGIGTDDPVVLVKPGRP